MEKDVAIREWCIEKALSIQITANPSGIFKVAELIEKAKAIEKYITGK